MRVVFFGASRLGYACCRLLLEKRLAEVVGIFTVPREFAISYSPSPVTNVLHADYHALGNEFNIQVIEVREKLTMYEESLRNMAPDFMLAIGWYHMIPSSLRNIATQGCAGIHASLLPRYRGGAPLVWAMIHGETETGVTLFYFADGVDNGDIIAQKRFAIEENDTIREMLGKVESASLEIIGEFLPRIADGTAPRIGQNESEATYVPQRKPEDGLIDWSWDSSRIRNFIRAQTRPYPGAFTIVGGKKVILWDADVIEDNAAHPVDGRCP